MNIDILIQQYNRLLSSVSLDFVRSIQNKINWDVRLVCIKGARGTGKTTLMLQNIKLSLSTELSKTLYVSLDNLWFVHNDLMDLVEYFYTHGGKYLYLDEVHKYPHWSIYIKNIYDLYPDLKVVFSGSSLLELNDSQSDLSRRSLVYHLQGLSFREYLVLKTKQDFPILSLEDILTNHQDLSKQIVSKVRPLEHFETYLKFGYYPYFLEGLDGYYQRLEGVVNFVMDIELPLLRKVEVSKVSKLKQLLGIISESVPFLPNVQKISERIDVSRPTILLYFSYLEEAKLITQMHKSSTGIKALQKPDKILLENTNLMYLLAQNLTNIGNVREAFVVNQLKNNYKVSFSEESDYLVQDKYTIEVGGKNKTSRQIKNLDQAFIASDNIEFGFANKIPLWLFGFVY